MGVYGYTYDGGKSLNIFIPMIFANNVSSIKITSLYCSLRASTGGFIGVGTGDSDYYFDITDYIESYGLYKAQGLIRVRAVKDSAFEKYTNFTTSTGTAIAGMINFVGNVKMAYEVS